MGTIPIRFWYRGSTWEVRGRLLRAWEQAKEQGRGTQKERLKGSRGSWGQTTHEKNGDFKQEIPRETNNVIAARRMV